MITPSNTIAVVIWYHPSMAELEALMLYANQVSEVIIVDNSDQSNEKLCTKINNASYLPLYGNVGIAKALNRGCQIAADKGAEWILTMDQDSRWDQQTLREYMDEINQYPNPDSVAIFSPYHDCGGHIHNERFQIVSAIMCSGNLLRVQAWKQANGFRDDFFIDLVDDEINCHLQQLGWNIVRANRIHLTHHLGDGIQHSPIFKHPYISHPASRYFFIGRNHRWMQRLYPKRAAHYRRSVTRELKRLMIYDWQEDKWNKIKQFLKGWKQGKHL